jgi:signal peptidase I
MWASILAVAAILGVAAALGVRWLRRRFVAVSVSGPSMEPTLVSGDRVLVRRCSLTAVRPDGVVVFAEETGVGDLPPNLPDDVRGNIQAAIAKQAPTWIVKRVVAVPGDRVPKAEVPALAHVDHEVVPAGMFVVLGDNPSASHDSRSFGYVTADRLLGVVQRKL